jgi:hypothetical protein
MEIWEYKPPGTLWATPGLLRGPLYLLNVSIEKVNHDFFYNILKIKVNYFYVIDLSIITIVTKIL